MTVKELKQLLLKYPDNMPVAYQIYSEARVLEDEDILVRAMQPPRADGWIHYVWKGEPKLPEVEYLLFPGN